MKTSLSIRKEGLAAKPHFWVQLTLLLFLWLLISFFARAQTKVWDKTIGGDKEDNFTAMVATSDGGYLLGGSSYSGKSGDKSEPERGSNDPLSYDYWVVKIDVNGNKLWDKTFGGNSSDELHALVATPDGGYLLGGSSYSGKSGDKSENNRGTLQGSFYDTPDYWVVKIDANGNKVWDRTFGGKGYDDLTASVSTSDGGFLLGGSSNSGEGEDKSEVNGAGCEQYCSYDYWVVKIDANGTKIWDKTFGGNKNDKLTSLIVTKDSGYLLGGFSESEISGDKSEASRDAADILNNKGDYWVVKIDTDGKKLWDKTIGGTLKDELYSMLFTADGGYLVGGSSNSNISGEKSEAKGGYWIVKLDSNGKKVWDKSYSAGSLTAMIALPSGGFVLAGFSSRRKGADKSEDKSGCWLVKVKENGTKVWDKTFGDGGYALNHVSLVVTPDENYLLGTTSSQGISEDKTQESKGSNDYWVLKVEDTNKKSQTITFNSPLLTKTYGEVPFILLAKASSGLPVTFRVESGPATLTNNTLSLTGVGKVTIKASQAGNNTYSAALDGTQIILVDPSIPVTKVWDKTFSRRYNDELTTVITTSDGGHLLGGISRLYMYQEAGFRIVKIDSKGQTEWDKDLGGNDDRRLSLGVMASDGGYLFGGSLGLLSMDDESQDFYLFKTDKEGTKEWERQFRGPALLSAMIATSDGGYLLGGTTNEIKGKDKTEPPRGGRDYWVLKVDAAGNKLWDKTLGGKQDDYLASLVATPDGGYLVGGSSNSDKGGDKSENKKDNPNEDGYFSDYWVVKLDATGKKVWDRTFGADKFDNLTAMVNTADGGYLVGGSSYSDKGGDKTEGNKGNLDEFDNITPDYWVVKLNSKGKKVWDKTFGSKQTDALTVLLPTSDGGYLLGGDSDSNIGGDKTGEYRGGLYFQSGDYWLIKIDSKGQKLWDKTLGGDDSENLVSLVAAQDGSYLVGGSSRSGANGDKSESGRELNGSQRGDWWLVKIKEELPLTAQWDMRYGGSGNESFTTIIRTVDGGYLSGGYSSSGVSGDKSQASQGKNDYWILKSDKDGKKLWDKRYGGSEDDYLNRIIQTKDSGYLLAGSSLSGKGGDKIETSQGDRDYWIIKIDKAGTKEWDKKYGGSGSDELKKVLELSTGEFILAGYSNSLVSGDKSQASWGGNDYWLVKISSKGEKLWDKRYGGSLNETLTGIVQTANGGFLLGGSSLSGKSGDKSEISRGGSDFWLINLDKNGNKLWDKAYGGSGEDEAYSLGQGETSYYFISGQSDSPAGLDKSRDSQGGKDFWFIKVTSSGAKIWDKRFGGTLDEELRASLRTSDGGYLLAGKSFSNMSGNKRQDSQGSSDYWIVKTDKDGQYQWSKTFGGSSAEELRAVLQTNDGGFLLGGKSNSGVSGDRTQPSQGGSDYWLVKVAPEAKPIVAEREVMIVAESKEKLNVLQGFPNPFSEVITVRFTLPQTQDATLKVYDGQGITVTTLFQGEAKANQTYKIDWQARNQPAGMYLLQLHTLDKNQIVKLLLSR
ncbi:T9SS type A sorting domain-containing protein [Adhaeribacter radiodurans]|uniref:T9SS type A sorting domain-containing protein n=1 Tax=Adhaeribacter radiodurans TaxID=2745197 RepID=A0A7L7L7R0_9BACT|nr:T9SS type A sorting domain-containing protein [Adhaeribacter radiodurans]QMU28784.1 T9SS type A sorting domain-containing protein [Adhaeribacter radiodurans]